MSGDAIVRPGKPEFPSKPRSALERILVRTLIAALLAVTLWQAYARFGYSRTLPRLLAAIRRDQGSNAEPLLLQGVDQLIGGRPLRVTHQEASHDVVEYHWQGPFRSYKVLLTVQKQAPQAVIAVETNRDRADHREIIEAMAKGRDPLSYDSETARVRWQPPTVIASQRVVADALKEIGGRIEVGTNGEVLSANLHQAPVSETALSGLVTLVSLRNLSLSDSHCSDAELRHVGACVNLKQLDLWKTDVTDPGMYHLHPLAELETLVLVETRVSGLGLEPVGQLSNLRMLQLGRTQVADAGLGHLSGLQQLRELRLDETQVGDAGLEQLQELPSLKILNLTGTRVSGGGLAHLQDMSELQRLDLERTELTQTGLQYLTRLPNLNGISLAGASLSVDGVKHDDPFPSLNWLSLSETNLTDDMLASMKGLGGVQEMNLSDTQVTDAGIGELASLSSLRRLDIVRTKVTGPGLSGFADMPHLTSLSVGGMEITDKSLEFVGQLTQLKSLSFGGGAPITDGGLVHLEQLRDLEHLDLTQVEVEGSQFQNFITDRGLRHLRGLTNLKVLSLMGTHVSPRGVNRLQRAIPRCLIQL